MTNEVAAWEDSVARNIFRLSQSAASFGAIDISSLIEKVELSSCISFAPMQREALFASLNNGVMILTGGPGTGKTTTLNGIIRIFEKLDFNICLAAPTGRAAKRMSEVTGREAKTLHRLLEVEWGPNHRPVFMRNERNPLDCNIIIVDELSMVDIILFESLLSAMPRGCRLIMVGIPSA